MYAPPTGETIAVHGVVRAASRAPKPGTVPYKDHIIMVHLAELDSADDLAAAGKEAVVFVWSMRNNVQTPAARWRPGDTVMWDNRCILHRGTGYDADRYRRYLRQTRVRGAGPTLEEEPFRPNHERH